MRAWPSRAAMCSTRRPANWPWAQVESLAKYCKDKNLTLNQFLFEQMGFINPKALPKELEGMIAPAQTTYYLLRGPGL